MLSRLLLLLCLAGHSFTKEPPDVECLVVHMQYVNCSWDKQGPPEFNYTFSSWFHNDNCSRDCSTYVSTNGTATGCNQPFGNLTTQRFDTFYTLLTHGSKTFKKDHHLKGKVLLYPPVNLTVKNGTDHNLWYYWNQTTSHCVESNIRYRVNKNKWELHAVSVGSQSFCINLPSTSARYELQVQSKMGSFCGESLTWSDWSDPVVWGSNNGTDITPKSSMSVWTPLLYVVGAVTLILLTTMLLHHERLRIIPISVVPKPSLVFYGIEDWLQFSKGLKGNFKTNFNEQPCTVREYCHVSQSDSESSDGSTCSATTDQTDCSVSMPAATSVDLSDSSSGSSGLDEQRDLV